MGALLAITAWLAEGLILTAIAGALSRWLGKGASTPKPRGGEAAWSRRADLNSRTDGVSLTHPDAGTRL